MRPSPSAPVAARDFSEIVTRLHSRLLGETDATESARAGKTLAYTRIELHSAETGKLLAFGALSRPPSLPQLCSLTLPFLLASPFSQQCRSYLLAHSPSLPQLAQLLCRCPRRPSQPRRPAAHTSPHRLRRLFTHSHRLSHEVHRRCAQEPEERQAVGGRRADRRGCRAGGVSCACSVGCARCAQGAGRVWAAGAVERKEEINLELTQGAP